MIFSRAQMSTASPPESAGASPPRGRGQDGTCQLSMGRVAHSGSPAVCCSGSKKKSARQHPSEFPERGLHNSPSEDSLNSTKHLTERRAFQPMPGSREPCRRLFT